MANQTKYRVNYASFDAPKKSSTAKFSDRNDAFKFARQQLHAEVSDKSGLIAQFRLGRSTPEFEQAA